MKKNILAIIFAVFCGGIIYAQTTVSLSNVTLSSKNIDFSVDVNMRNLNNAGAVSLTINYDTSKVSFLEIPDPLPGNFIYNSVKGQIIIAWASVSDTLNINDGKLLTLNFHHLNGNSALNFTDCEIADVDGNVLDNINFIDGSINLNVPKDTFTASIGDKVWIDSNKNGIQDQNEAGLPWVTVELYTCENHWLAYTLTDQNGNYKFDSLGAGSYYTKFYLTDKNKVYSFTFPHADSSGSFDSDAEIINDTSARSSCFDLAAGEINSSIDAGVVPQSNSSGGTIGDFVWNDINENGIQDEGETGVPDIKVNLLNCSDSTIFSTVTDKNGLYSFTNLSAGNYKIEILLSNNYKLVEPLLGDNRNKDSDINPNGKSDCFSLAENTQVINIDAGLVEKNIIAPGNFSYNSGSTSTIDNFSTTGFETDFSLFPEKSYILSGGAQITGELHDWISLFRYLNPAGNPVDLSEFNSISFQANGTGKVYILIDLSTINNYNYFVYPVNLTLQQQVYKIEFQNLKQQYGDEIEFDASKIRAVGFMISSLDNSGLVNFKLDVKNIGFIRSTATSVQKDEKTPTEFGLSQNFPNPFNPSTNINFTIPKADFVTLKVYDILGKEVSTLIKQELAPGNYSVNFDAKNLSSGVYLYRLSSSTRSIIKKMILTK